MCLTPHLRQGLLGSPPLPVGDGNALFLFVIFFMSIVTASKKFASAPRLFPVTPGMLGDLHVYDPVAMAWTDLSAAASGTLPSPRAGHGFTAAGGKLYLHGGEDYGNGGPLLHSYGRYVIPGALNVCGGGGGGRVLLCFSYF